MFDWILFESHETALKVQEYFGESFPLSTLVCLSHLCITFIKLFVISILFTLDFSHHVHFIWDNTVDLILDFGAAIQQLPPPSHHCHPPSCPPSCPPQLPAIMACQPCCPSHSIELLSCAIGLGGSRKQVVRTSDVGGLNWLESCCMQWSLNAMRVLT